MSVETVWVAVGFVGQAMFFMRFFIQWIQTERHRRSVIPLPFWYFSIAGGLVLLSYAIYREDPVFIAGQAGGIVVYSRNLYFIFRERREARENPPAAPSTG